ncbi:integrase [Vibrio mediterranei]|uniref:integrase n=1 Tax=Vibrio mediterranei TaxID=689 RepID=UPI00148D373C|nr:integrase [Vibrio mediterranei]NOI26066.1 tyrosine-type recombinase/integrase [Vibrio mediterranei]
MKKDIPRITETKQIDRYLTKLRSSIDNNTFDELTSYRYSKNSVVAMTKDWHLFNEFCIYSHYPSLPASVATIKAFFEREQQTRKYSTLKRYAVTISLIHYLFEFKDPIKSREVGLLLEKIRVLGVDSVSETQALTQEHLKQLRLILGCSQSPKDIRDMAIYSVMFECALKRRDLRQLSRTNIQLNEYGDCFVEIEGAVYQLSNESSTILLRWLELTPCSTVFTGIDRHGNIKDNELNDSSIFRILRQASNILDLPFEVKFSSQSCRVGAVKKLAQDGLKIKEIQEFGRWASPAMPLQYSGKRTLSEKEKAKFKDDNNYD